MNPPHSPRRAVQFGIQGLFVALLICAVLLGWWRDRRQLTQDLERTKALLEALRHVEQAQSGPKPGMSVPGVFRPKPNKCATPEDFIKALRTMEDWYEFADETADPFVKTPIADAAIPALIELLSDPDQEIRKRALSTLGKMGRKSETIVPAVIPLLDDAHPNVRWHAAFTLSSFGDDAKAAIPALWRQINDDDSPIAAFAAEMLHRIDPSADVLPRLRQLLKNHQKENRGRAIDALAELRSPQAKQALVEAFREEKDPELRERLAGAIAWLDKEEQKAGVKGKE
jgi:hypothetical protein